MSEASEKLRAILDWASGADPTDAVLLLSAVDYEAGLNWRNIAVLKVEDVRALLAERESAAKERGRLTQLAAAALRDKGQLWQEASDAFLTLTDAVEDEHGIDLTCKQKAAIVKRELEAVQHNRDYYRECYETACSHVAEACEMLGLDRNKVPCDTWALREAASKVRAERDRLRTLIESLRQLAEHGFRHWYADEDHKAGKILQAMAGVLPGYCAATDAMLAALSPAKRTE